MEKGHIGEIETAVESYLSKAPRVVVDASGQVDAMTVSSVREAFSDLGKIPVVATDEERTSILSEQRNQSDLRFDSKSICKMGQEIPANTLLKINAVHSESQRFITLSLLDLNTGCQLQSATARWSNKNRTMALEVVGKLMAKLKRHPLHIPNFDTKSPASTTQAGTTETPDLEKKDVTKPVESKNKKLESFLNRTDFEKLLASPSFERRLGRRLGEETMENYGEERRSGGNFAWCWMLPGSCMYMLGTRGHTKNILYGAMYTALYVAGAVYLISNTSLDGSDNVAPGILMINAGVLGHILHGYFAWDDYNRDVMREVVEVDGLK